jgi:hypothetical protein
MGASREGVEYFSEETLYRCAEVHPLRNLCGELPGTGKGGQFQKRQGKTAGLRLQKMYPLFLLPGNVPEKGDPREIKTKLKKRGT